MDNVLQMGCSVNNHYERAYRTCNQYPWVLALAKASRPIKVIRLTLAQTLTLIFRVARVAVGNTATLCS